MLGNIVQDNDLDPFEGKCKVARGNGGGDGRGGESIYFSRTRPQ